jgi:hypothetical protein
MKRRRDIIVPASVVDLMMERLSWEVFAADAARKRQEHAGDHFMLS